MTSAAPISDLWEPIWKYITELNNQRSMPGVHHYTSVKGALGILESGQLWFEVDPERGTAGAAF